MLEGTIPKVSVILPCYNSELFIEERVRTIFEQTFQDFELICLDDCSTDRSIDYLRSIADGGRITFIENEKNSGSPFKQWNKGASLAQGEYLWFAEADDYSDPKFLERLVEVLDSNPAVGVAYCQSRLVDSAGKLGDSMIKHTAEFQSDRWATSFISNGREECIKVLSRKNTIPNASAVLLRKSIFEAVGRADDSMLLCGDWFTWIKMLTKSDIAFIPDILNYFRKTHSSSVRKRTFLAPSKYKEISRIMTYLLVNFKDEHSLRSVLRKEIVKIWLRDIVYAKGFFAFRSNYEIYRIIRSFDNKAWLAFPAAIGWAVMHGTRVFFRNIFKPDQWSA
ncbi:glycosyltransferase family 2 protein [Oligoflexia bacterium]|nr:glycosyltransferase family 2 protein [Oligoflexia bacterium]